MLSKQPSRRVVAVPLHGRAATTPTASPPVPKPHPAEVPERPRRTVAV
jgi:hypothetical protein